MHFEGTFLYHMQQTAAKLIKLYQVYDLLTTLCQVSESDTISDPDHDY